MPTTHPFVQLRSGPDDGNVRPASWLQGDALNLVFLVRPETVRFPAKSEIPTDAGRERVAIYRLANDGSMVADFIGWKDELNSTPQPELTSPDAT